MAAAGVPVFGVRVGVLVTRAGRGLGRAFSREGVCRGLGEDRCQRDAPGEQPAIDPAEPAQRAVADVGAVKSHDSVMKPLGGDPGRELRNHDDGQHDAGRERSRQ